MTGDWHNLGRYLISQVRSFDESPCRGLKISGIGAAARAAVQSLVSPPHGRRMCHKFVNPYFASEDYSVNGVGVLPYQEGELDIQSPSAYVLCSCANLAYLAYSMDCNY